MSESRGVRAASRRLFFALWPTDDVRAQVFRQTRKVVEQSRGRPIRERNLHVTLLFLGGIAPGCVGSVHEAAEGAGSQRFDLQLDQLLVWSRARVLVLASTNTPAPLRELFESLRISLLQRQVALQPEEEYRPHLTLARNASRPEELPAFAPVAWHVTDFVLVESTLGAEGSQYEVIARWPLA